MGEGNIEQMLKDMLTKLNKTVSEEQFAGLVEHYKDNPDMIINDYATKTGKNIDLKTRVGLKRNYQVPLSFKETLALGESRGEGLSPDTTNSESTAYGPFQITETHHKDRIKSLYGADWGTFQKDPKLQEQYMDVIEEDYNKALPAYKNYPVSKQRNLTDEQVKAAIHVLGASGAKTYLQTGKISDPNPEKAKVKEQNLNQILDYFTEERANYGAPAGVADQYKSSGTQPTNPQPQTQGQGNSNLDLSSLSQANEQLKKNTAKLKSMPKMSGEVSVQIPTTSGHGALLKTEELFKPVKDKKTELDGNMLTQAADYLSDVGAGITGLFKYGTIGSGYSVSQRERERQKKLEYEKLESGKKDLYKSLPAEGIPAVSIEDAVELELASPKVNPYIPGMPTVSFPSSEEAHRKGAIRIKEHTALLKGLVDTRKESLSKEEISIVDNIQSLDPEFLASYQMSDNMKSYILAQDNLNKQLTINGDTFAKFEPLVEESYKAILNARQNGTNPKDAFNEVISKFSSENPADAAAIASIKEKIGTAINIAEPSIGIPVAEQVQETSYGLGKTAGAIFDFTTDYFGSFTRVFSNDSKFDKELIRDLSNEETVAKIKDIVVNNPNDASTSDLIEELVKVGDRTLVLKGGKVDKIRDKEGKQVYYLTKQDEQAVEQYGKHPEKYTKEKSVNFEAAWQQSLQIGVDMVPMIAASAATGGGAAGMMLGSATVSFGDYYEQALAESGDISKSGLYAAMTSGTIGYVESRWGKAEALLGRSFAGAEKSAIIKSIEESTKKVASKGVLASRLERGHMQMIKDGIVSSKPILKEVPMEVVGELLEIPTEGTTAALFEMPYESPSSSELINIAGLTMLTTTALGVLGGVAGANKENMNSLISLGVNNRDAFKQVSEAWVQAARDKGLPESEITRRQKEVEKKSKLIDTVGKYYDYIKEESEDVNISGEKKNAIMDLAQQKAMLDYKAEGSTSTIRRDKIAAEAAEVQKKLDKLVYSGTDIAEPITDSDEDIKQKEEAAAQKKKDKEEKAAAAVVEEEAAPAAETTTTKSKVAYDFDGTLFDNKTGQLTELGKQVKERIAAGEDISVVTARKGDNTAEIKQALGISADKIVATGDETKKGEELDKLGISRQDYYDSDQAKLDAIRTGVKTAVGDAQTTEQGSTPTATEKVTPTPTYGPQTSSEAPVKPITKKDLKALTPEKIQEIHDSLPPDVARKQWSYGVGKNNSPKPILFYSGLVRAVGETEARNLIRKAVDGTQAQPTVQETPVSTKSEQTPVSEQVFTYPNGKTTPAVKKDGKWFLPEVGALNEDGTYAGAFASDAQVKQLNEKFGNADKVADKVAAQPAQAQPAAEPKKTEPQAGSVGVGGDENAWGSDKGLTENFYTTDVDGYAIKKPITNPSSVTIDGVDFHIAKVDGDWKVIEKKSGLEISTGKISNTKNAAIEDATIRLAQNGGAKNLPTLIDRAIQGFKDRNTKAVEQSLKETPTETEVVGVGGDNPALKEIGVEIKKDGTSEGFYQVYKDGKFVGLLGATSFEQARNKGQHFDEGLMSDILTRMGIEHSKAERNIQGENEFLTIRIKNSKAVEQSIKETPQAETKNQIQLSRLNKNKRAEKRDNDVIENGTIYKADKDIKLKKGKTGKRDASGKLITAHPDVKGSFFTMDPIIADEYARGGGKVIDVTIPKGATVEVVNVDQKLPLDEIRRQETELINNSKADVVKLVTMDGKGMEVQYIIPPAAAKTETPQEDKATEKEVETLLEPIGKTPQERENQIFQFFALAAAGGDKIKAREIARVTNNLWENVAKQLGKRSKQAAEAWIQAKVALIGKTSVAGATGMGNAKFQADNANLSVQQAIDKINNNLIPEIDRLIKEMSNKDNIKKRGWTTAQAAEHVRGLRAVKAQVEKNMKDPKFQVDAKFRAATIELANNQFIIAALDAPNESTFIHEMVHAGFESDLLPEEKQTFIDEYNELFGEKEKGWSTDVSEYFARVWEKYLSNGRKLTSAEVKDKGRRETLQEVFDKFTDWLQGIYNGVIEYNNSKGVKKEITLSPAAQAIFDNINNIKTQTKDENKESSQSNGQGQRQDEKRGKSQEDEVRGQGEKGNVTTNQQTKDESKNNESETNKGQERQGEGQVGSTLAEEQGKGKGEEVGDVVEGAVKLSPKYQRYVSRALATPSIPQEFKDALLKNAPLKVPVTYAQVEAFAKAVVDQLETLDDYVKAAGELVQQFAETITKVDTDPTVLNRGAWEITALKMIEKRVADNYGPTEAAKLHQRLANVGSILGQSLRQYGINDPSVMYVQTFGRHSVTESPIYDADTFEGSDVTHRDVANSLLDLYESAMQDEKDKLKAKIAAEIKAQSQKDKAKDTSSKTDADPNTDAKKAKTDLVKRLSDKADFYLDRFNSRLGGFSSGFDIEAIIDYTLYAYFKTAGSVVKTKRILEKRFGNETVDTNWDTISNSENFKKATLDIAQEKLLAAIGNAGQANEFTGTETSNRTPAQMIIQSITRQLQKKDRGPVSKKTIEEVITQKSMDIDTVSNLRRDINGGLLNVEADKRAEVLAQVDDLLAVLVKGQLDAVATPWVKKTLIRQKIKESADNLGVTVDQLIEDIANRATITNSISEEFLSRTGMSVEDAAPYIKIIEDSIESEINQKVKAKAEKLIVDSYGKNIIKLEEVVKTLEGAFKFNQDNLDAKKAELSDAVRNKTKSVEELREMQKGVKELQAKAAESKKKLQTYKTRLSSGQKELKRKVSSKTFQRMPTVERVGFLVRNGGLSDETVFQAFAEVIGARNFTQADAETLRSLYERLDTSLFQIDKKEAKEAIAKFAFEIKSDIDKQIFVDILDSYAFGNMLGAIKSGDVALSSGYLTFLYQEIMSTGAQISKDIFSLITGKSSEFANVRLMLDSFSNMRNTNFSRAQFIRVAIGKDGISLPEISLKGDESKGFNARLEANMAHLDKMRSLRDRAKEQGNVKASFMYNATIGHAIVSRILIVADYVTTSTLLPYKLHRNLAAASIKELTVDGLIHPSYNEIRELVASKMRLDEVEAQLKTEGLTPRVMIKGESKRSNAYHKRKAQILYEFLQESDKISLIQAEHALRTICFTGKISGYSGYAVEKLNKFFNNLSSIGEDKKSGEKKLSVLIAASLAKLTTMPFPGVTFRVAQFVKNSTPFGVIQLKDKLNRDKSIMPFKFFDEYNFYNTYTGEIETVPATQFDKEIRWMMAMTPTIAAMGMFASMFDYDDEEDKVVLAEDTEWFFTTGYSPAMARKMGLTESTYEPYTAYKKNENGIFKRKFTYRDMPFLWFLSAVGRLQEKLIFDQEESLPTGQTPETKVKDPLTSADAYLAAIRSVLAFSTQGSLSSAGGMMTAGTELVEGGNPDVFVLKKMAQGSLRQFIPFSALQAEADNYYSLLTQAARRKGVTAIGDVVDKMIMSKPFIENYEFDVLGEDVVQRPSGPPLTTFTTEVVERLGHAMKGDVELKYPNARKVLTRFMDIDKIKKLYFGNIGPESYKATTVWSPEDPQIHHDLSRDAADLKGQAIEKDYESLMKLPKMEFEKKLKKINDDANESVKIRYAKDKLSYMYKEGVLAERIKSIKELNEFMVEQSIYIDPEGNIKDFNYLENYEK